MRFGAVWILVAGCIEYSPKGDIDPGGLTALEETTPGGPGQDAPPVTVPEGHVLDTFDLPAAGGAIDVIVFGDTSGSMDEELETLGATITPFVERLAEQVSDWQLAAVTGDVGCAVNGILTPSTPDFARKFAEGIVTPTASEDMEEMGFLNTAIAVEEADGGCNDGLVRGDLLHVIYVTDENDESPGYEDDDDYWTAYFDRIAAVHGNPQSIVLSAVAGPVPGGCGGDGDDDEGADAGEGYDRAVEATGGEFLSICSDWADDIDLLVDAGTTRDRFGLTEEPVPDTIEVWVNGVAAPEADWEYRAAENEVVFVANPPRAGDRVDVTYEPAS
jgi:hypothetical protein